MSLPGVDCFDDKAMIIIFDRPVFRFKMFFIVLNDNKAA